jgi:pyridoxamine 5'-phosphate oxidase family protein
MTQFSEAEREYLDSQRLGRLATVDDRGRPQNNPVGFFVREDGTLDIGGYAMGTTRKWRNIGGNPEAAIVVDDIASVQPWKVRGIEIRGTAEQVTGPHEYGSVLSEELIRIHPRSIRSWGLDGD